MRKLILSAPLLALAACTTATAGGAGAAGPSAPVYETSGGQTVVRTRDDVAPAERIDASVQRVWDVLPAVYRQLGVDEVGQDPVSRTVGNGRVTAMRTFAGEPIANFLNCGATALGTPAANEHRVQMSLRTTVTAAGTTAADVRTEIEATARSNQGTSSDLVRCTSFGKLERRIAGLVREKLAGM